MAHWCHSPDISSYFYYFLIWLYTASTLVAVVKRVLKMEKLPEYQAEEDIEEWLEIFECRAACSKISNEKTKIQWCKSVIGGVGRRILKVPKEESSWEEAKQELRRFLGEGDSRAAPWKKLRRYQAKGKCYGEIASEVRK